MPRSRRPYSAEFRQWLILRKAVAWFAMETTSSSSRDSKFVRGHRAAHPIATMCRVLGVSRSRYYAW